MVLTHLGLSSQNAQNREDWLTLTIVGGVISEGIYSHRGGGIITQETEDKTGEYNDMTETTPSRN